MKNWDEFVLNAAFNHNVSCKKETGFSAFELIYGQMTILEVELTYNTPRLVCHDDNDILKID